MRIANLAGRLRNRSVVSAAILALVGAHSAMAQPASGAGPYGPSVRDLVTHTPIKHVIIIIGENRTFDHVFATYEPKSGETVWNLLSEKIVNPDGSPGPSYAEAPQSSATDTSKFELSPPRTAYLTLPPAPAGGPFAPYGCQLLGISANDCNTPANVLAVMKYENGLAPDYYQYLLTGGNPYGRAPDPRISYDGEDASSLPPGAYQLTNTTHAPFLPYNSYTASPVHRLFQMWQQLGCDAGKATTVNPSGCSNDLFAWVEHTVGAGSNGKAPPSGGYAGEGSTAPQFLNMQEGDAPYLKFLADTYTMSDNYHQGVLGGTGANHIILGTGDAAWFSDGKGTPEVPPNNPVDPAAPGTPLPGHSSALSEIENPDPMPGTNNFYTQDGYGGGSGSPAATAPSANYGGGSYVDCADSSQPGVGAVRSYLAALSIKPNCEAGHYYLVNNYNPGYLGDGTNAYTDKNPDNNVFTIPPSNLRTIGNELSDTKISWAYFGDQFNLYLKDPYGLTYPAQAYCNICNWAQYNTAIMTNPAARNLHLHDTTDFYAGIAKGKLPAVSWVKPSGLVDGHPSSSKLDLFEGFVKKIVDGVQANPDLEKNTAIFITFDEGGGYYDSGYVQPLDFFGDGTRIPMIVVSKFSQGGHISHTYADHVSTLKFIEANWGLRPITVRSRDNLPDPTPGPNAYVPGNRPAIGDLMDMFNFGAPHP